MSPCRRDLIRPRPNWWETGPGTHSHDKILSHGNVSPFKNLIGKQGGHVHSHKILSCGNMSPLGDLMRNRGGADSHDIKAW